MRKVRRCGYGITLLVLFLVSLTGCQQVASQPTIQIGEINPLTGRLAAPGTAVHQGILYAVDEVNARGGIRGRRVVLISRDDESRPERAIAAAEELTSRAEVLALVGGYVDSLVGPISEVAERNRVPYLATASLDPRLTQRGYRYFFRMSNMSPYVDATVGFIADMLKARRVALIYSDTPGATQLARLQKAAFEEREVTITVFESFKTGLPDFTPFLVKAQEADSEVLLMNGFFADNLVILRQMHEQDIRFSGFLGTFGMEFPAIIQRLGPAAEYAFGTTGWEPGITTPGTEAASQAYVEGYTARYGQPPVPLSMHGYAAAKAVLYAIETVLARGQPLTRENVRDALANIDLLLPLEHLRFDENGDPVAYQRVIIQIQNGEHIVVYPPERATGQVVYPMPGGSQR